MARYSGHPYQQLLRIDREHTTDITENIEKNVLANIKSVIDKVSCVVFSDYNKGLLTKNLISKIKEISNEKTIMVNVKPPKGEMFNGVTWIISNLAETKKELGLETYTKSVSASENVHTLKSYVLDFYKKGNLNGVLFVGDIPTGYFYHPDTPQGVFTSEGLILGDYIYQDFLNACAFSTERNAFSYKNEECQVGVTIQPYWVARLTPNSSNNSDIELLKDYFRRNHGFRNVSYTFEQKALLYQPTILDDKEAEQETINKIKKDIAGFGGVYQTGNYKFIDIFSPTSDNDYLSELSRGYETLIFNGHGAPTFHQKNITPKSQIDSNFFFGNFLSCSVGRFTTKDYLAGEYLFSGGLVSLAASVPVFATSDFDAEFHIMLVNNVPFYKAIEFNGIGSNILGDPTLRMRYNQSAPSQSKIKVSANQLVFSKNNPTHEFTIENISDSPLYFYVRGKYLKQKNHAQLKSFGSGFDANAKTTESGEYLLEPHKKTVVNIQSEYYFPYGEMPTGTYYGKYFIVSSDARNPLASIDLSFIVK